MKALILAAGFGTRLLPYTETVPKPLFRLNNKPLIKRIIDSLIKYECSSLFINTHYKNELIEEYIKDQNFPIPVNLVNEKKILDTGGAIKNIFDITDSTPLMVVNSDIYTDINFKEVYDFHINKKNRATLCLLKNKYNNVVVEDGIVKKFKTNKSPDYYTFTGIQVIDPSLKNYFEFYESSIEAYKKIIQNKIKINAYILNSNIDFHDLGTIESFRNKSLQLILENSGLEISMIQYEKKLKGDGSDRKWSRIYNKNKSFIVADHGLCPPDGDPQAKSFIMTGKHLFEKKLFVPEIIGSDLFSGLVVVEDLGDERLEDYIKKQKNSLEILKKTIDRLFLFSIEGSKGFTDEMAFQTSSYDEAVSFGECKYFENEFLKNYLDFNFNPGKLEPEFKYISTNILENSLTGLMHRDFQSRNIMIKNHMPYFIDFQGARKGPLQYDLASLLIDPYMDLSWDLRDNLLKYSSAIADNYGISEDSFKKSYYLCALSRNLHILGAFSFLSIKKNKSYFKSYIPPAVKSLVEIIYRLELKELDYLKTITESIHKRRI